MNDWKTLEDKTKSLFQEDKAKIVPGSGNGKHEEDVIGISTIIQCKCSDQKNITILSKDLQRLTKAAYLQRKTPIFITENNGELLLSIPDSTFLPTIVEYIILLSQLEKVLDELDDCTSMSNFNQIKEFVNKTLIDLHQRLVSDLQGKMSKIQKRFTKIYDDLTQYNLFEGQL